MDKLLTITVYADTTHYFTEKQILLLLDGLDSLGNFCDVLIPESVVRSWYEKLHDSGLPRFAGLSFEAWLNNVYDCDDTDGLFDYAAKIMGHAPELADTKDNKKLQAAFSGNNQ